MWTIGAGACHPVWVSTEGPQQGFDWFGCKLVGVGANQLNQFIFPDPRVKLAKGLRGRTLCGRSSVDAWTSSGLLAQLWLCLSKHRQPVLHLHLNPFSSFPLNFPQAPAACVCSSASCADLWGKNQNQSRHRCCKSDAGQSAMRGCDVSGSSSLPLHPRGHCPPLEEAGEPVWCRRAGEVGCLQVSLCQNQPLVSVKTPITSLASK